ncbi:hypothetical protein VIGAN_08216000 [Vigna angularis var. angularis]|uniref:Argonaute linker 1 domain-containing protein n=1 Tax=Vigna angularis var. angularis TaxID=157739 RepID=A0A0S3SRL4_PHAAN|nr:hypothetical protein VIGAN_08216000 [Vigna angularis var. angularis]
MKAHDTVNDPTVSEMEAEILMMSSFATNGTEDSLPPPPPAIPSDVVLEPEKKKVLGLPIARRGLGSKGRKFRLLTNHFKVNVGNTDGHFFQYSVSLSYEDGRPVEGKGVGRKVLDRVQELYFSQLLNNNKYFAYDGKKTVYTLGSLARDRFEFTVLLEDVVSTCRNNGNASPDGHGKLSENDKRMRRPNKAKCYNVEIKFASKIPLQAIVNALRGQDSDNYQEAIRVLDIIMRQHAAKQGGLLVRQSFFHNDPTNFADLGEGVLGLRGFHSSFRITQSGLSLNIDVSTTMIVTPGPVVDFLISNQNVKDSFSLDWVKRSGANNQNDLCDLDRESWRKEGSRATERETESAPECRRPLLKAVSERSNASSSDVERSTRTRQPVSSVPALRPREALKVSLRPRWCRPCPGVPPDVRRSLAGVWAVRWTKKRGFPHCEFHRHLRQSSLFQPPRVVFTEDAHVEMGEKWKADTDLVYSNMGSDGVQNMQKCKQNGGPHMALSDREAKE